MEKPLVSIIMGVYNAEKTIKRCINSILNQTYENWEFIICNDGSSDGTLNILNEYQKTDSRIKVISNKSNKKLAVSLNRCLKYAKGKYIARMDADDESLPQRLEVEVDFLERHEQVDLVGCNRIIFDEQGEYGIRKVKEYPTRDILIRDTPFAHPTIMMRKTVYDALGGYRVGHKNMRAEDLDLWIRFFEAGYKGYNIQEVLYRYHESRDDLYKRSVKVAIHTMAAFWYGYRVLNVPFHKRIWVLKPLVAALIPKWIMEKYHRIRLDKVQ